MSGALIEAVLQTTALMAVATLAALAFRRRSPEASHLAWRLGFASVVAISILGPRVAKRAWIGIPRAAESQVAAPRPHVPHPLGTPKGRDEGVAAAALPEERPAHRDFDPSWLWLAGSGLVAGRIALDLLALARLRRRSRKASEPLIETAQGLASGLGIGRRVCVRTAPIPVAMTFGALRPIVLLPEDADAWPAQQLEAILLHELAHVRRNDSASQLLADAACALYPFHPLVWLGARAMREVAELAVDDVVLQAGVRPSDYASVLLQTAASLGKRSPRLAYAGTPIMTKSQIETRLRSILAPTSRRGLTTLQALVAVAAVAVAAPVVATVGLKGQGEDPTVRKAAIDRLKRVAVATLMYTQDYDNDYPYAQSTGTVRYLVGPYVKDRTSFDDPTPGGRFDFNLNIGGVSMHQIEAPAEQPAWVERLPSSKSGFDVAYADGHVKQYAAALRPTVDKAWKKTYRRRASMRPLPKNYGLSASSR